MRSRHVTLAIALAALAGCSGPSSKPDLVWGKKGVRDGMFERPRELALPVRERPHHRDWPERAVAFGNEPSHRQLFARGPKSPLRERRCQTLSG